VIRIARGDEVPGVLTVATWNVRHGLDVRAGRVDLPAIAATIAALDVDVVALQEVDREQAHSGGTDQLAVLAGMLGWQGVFAPALLGDPRHGWRAGPGAAADPGGPAYGIGLLSRLRLGAVVRGALPGATDGRPGRRRRTAAPGWDREPRVVLRAEVGGVPVTTTHLSFLPWRGLRQLRAALGFAAAAGRAAVLMGDLNLPRRLLRPALCRATWDATHAGATYPTRRPGLALDHILTRSCRLRDGAVGCGGPSDHLPLLGRLELT
jgi:endonuclease/exonuclease/phosphatase family metal-dependent hydrolase